MITVRKAAERGHFNFGWLDTWHSFSFGEYYDPRRMGFGALRVINEDRVQPGAGFPPHPHRDMEILTYILAGELKHEDSMGNGSVIRPGDVQRMSAGTGVVHSEFNASAQAPVHLLQIWLLPERLGLAPGYEQQTLGPRALQGRLALIASRDGRAGSVTLHQDVNLYAGRLAAGQEARMDLAPGRKAWVQVARGAVRLSYRDSNGGDSSGSDVNGGDSNSSNVNSSAVNSSAVNSIALQAGDAAAVEELSTLRLIADTEAELLLFDLA